MAQKPVLRIEVGARALRVRSVSREEAWASAGVQGAWVCGRFLDWERRYERPRDQRPLCRKMSAIVGKFEMILPMKMTDEFELPNAWALPLRSTLRLLLHDDEPQAGCGLQAVLQQQEASRAGCTCAGVAH